LKGGIVLVEPETGTVARVIVLQYNPDTLTRTIQPRSTAAEAGDRLEALRLTGPPVETFKLDAELDATDQLEFPEQNPNAVEFGVQPQLAALETLVYPSSGFLQENNRLARTGTLEIAPAESPLTIFVWSKNRILPVRLTDFSVAEEQFDTLLNPIHAKVSIGMRVLSTNDFNFEHRGASLYMAYHQQKERLAGLSGRGTLAALGISRIG
jgi:hypothetical protein